MELIVVISLPLIVFFILVGAACYFYGRSKRRNRRNLPDHQVFGVPAPPPSTHFPLHPSSPPNKQHDNSSSANV
ncbi:hypothetical protein LINPERPRIM_LOCUS17991 [Linum perenne]